MHGIHAGANKIADRLVYWIRNPDRRQVAEAMLQGELLRIPPVCLDPLTRFAGNQCRCRHRAAVTKINKLSVDAITASAGLVTEFQATAPIGQSLGEFGYIRRRVGNGADETDFAVPSLLGCGDGNAHLVNVEANIERLLHDPSACRDCAHPYGAASRL